MAMTGSGLSAAIKAAFIAGGQPQTNDAMTDALGSAIIDYITSNAQLTGAVTTPNTTTGTITTIGSGIS